MTVIYFISYIIYMTYIRRIYSNAVLFPAFKSFISLSLSLFLKKENTIPYI